MLIQVRSSSAQHLLYSDLSVEMTCATEESSTGAYLANLCAVIAIFVTTDSRFRTKTALSNIADCRSNMQIIANFLVARMVAQKQRGVKISNNKYIGANTGGQGGFKFEL